MAGLIYGYVEYFLRASKQHNQKRAWAKKVMSRKRRRNGVEELREALDEFHMEMALDSEEWLRCSFDYECDYYTPGLPHDFDNDMIPFDEWMMRDDFDVGLYDDFDQSLYGTDESYPVFNYDPKTDIDDAFIDMECIIAEERAYDEAHEVDWDSHHISDDEFFEWLSAVSYLAEMDDRDGTYSLKKFHNRRNQSFGSR